MMLKNRILDLDQREIERGLGQVEFVCRDQHVPVDDSHERKGEHLPSVFANLLGRECQLQRTIDVAAIESNIRTEKIEQTCAMAAAWTRQLFEPANRCVGLSQQSGSALTKPSPVIDPYRNLE